MTIIFQNFDIYPAYLREFHATWCCEGFSVFEDRFLDDGFNAVHVLSPVRRKKARFSIGNDLVSQRLWAKENGLKGQLSLDDILCAQLEDSKAEIFYNMDPIRFDSSFLKKLPSNVRRSVCWRAAPGPFRDFTKYDLVICNFPTILKSFRDAGCKTALFYPAYNEVFESFVSLEKPTDISFVGTYSRHHTNRIEMLDVLAGASVSYDVRLHLLQSRLTRFANSPIGLLPWLKDFRIKKRVLKITQDPIFGSNLYRLFGQSKIVLNGAVDMSGGEKGNMRCWEVLASGSLLLCDEGEYPDGFEDGETFVTYKSVEDLKSRLAMLLEDPAEIMRIAGAGRSMVADQYSEVSQWERFKNLI